MPRAAKSCRIFDCPHLRPCPTPGHEPEAWAGSTRRSTLPPGWEKIRRRILERDPICTECGEALSTEVHHRGDRNDHSDEMLAGICAGCHNRISSQQGHDAQRKQRAAGRR